MLLLSSPAVIRWGHEHKEYVEWKVYAEFELCCHVASWKLCKNNVAIKNNFEKAERWRSLGI